MSRGDQTVYEMLHRNAVESAAAPALIGAEQTLSHHQLIEAVDRLGAGMAARGIVKGDRVAILSLNSVDYLNLYGACAKLGAIACPINWRLSPAEITNVIDLFQPRMLAVGPAYTSALEAVDPSVVGMRVVLGADAPEGALSIQALYQAEGAEVGGAVSSDPFAILPTAAVAGIPRGATLTHANFIAASRLLIEALGLGPADRHLAALPLFHITGLGLSLSLLQAGGANVVLESFDPAQAARAIDEHQVTVMADFPPVLETMLTARSETGARWDSLRYVVGLDAPDTIQRLHQETGAKFWSGFGQSETTGVVTLGSVEERPGSAGRPLPGLQVRCVNQQDEDVPVGEPGEIAVQGPVVFSGYWQDPDATGYALRGGWHHTGDLGKFDAEGYLFYVGRKPEKELIKTGGENVYPEEVERVIRELPAVAAVCVIGVPDETWGEAVKAVVELAPGETLSADQIQAAVAAHIASYKKPRRVEFIDSLPRTAAGEIDREAVKAAHG